MKLTLSNCLAVLCITFATTVAAQTTHEKEDVVRHQAMASAHQGAAQCLQSGKAEGVCKEALKKSCKGLAIGAHCGMKSHSHDHGGKEDSAKHVQSHQTMAKSHEEAAQCLAGGKGEKSCHAALRESCKGLAIGKYCGMKHAH